MPFFARLWLAIVCFFRIVFDSAFAARIGAAASVPHDQQALQLLSMLQREGRLIDFCEEEIAGVADAQLGAAARTVHDGCRKTLRSAFDLLPVRAEAEGEQVTLPAGFDPRAVRLTGNVVGNPPFTGVLRHHGWKAGAVRMPNASGDPTLLAPAEVELP